MTAVTGTIHPDDHQWLHELGFVCPSTTPTFIFVDLFCGAGGVTIGLRAARNKQGHQMAVVAAAVNHDANAILSHKTNHPYVKHFTEDIRTLNIEDLCRLIDYYRAVFPNAKIVLWASCECTNLSNAKGGLPRDRDSRTLANDLFRYIEKLQPHYIQIENVEEFLAWGPLDDNGKPLSKDNGKDYLKWKSHIETYGYRYDYRLLNSADFGAYTKRIRYFGIFAKGDLPIAWPTPTHSAKGTVDMFSNLKPWLAVKEVLNMQDEGKSILNSLQAVSAKAAHRYLRAKVKIIEKKKAYYATLRQIVVLPKKVRNPDIGLPDKLVLTQGHRDTFTCRVKTYAAQHGLTQEELAFYKYDPLCEKTLSRIYAGLTRYVAGGDPMFFQQANTGNPKSMVTDVHQPCRTLTAKGGNLALVQAKPLKRSVASQHGFIAKYYGTGGQLSSLTDPAGTLTTKDRMALLMTSQLDNAYSELEACNEPVTEEAKVHSLIIHHHAQSNTHLIPMGDGHIGMALFETDSIYRKKIKEFMVMYGLTDVKMRMLTVAELKGIQGFPSDYFLAGSQTNQKKFIGNAVVPVIPQYWLEALEPLLNVYHQTKLAA